MSCTFSQCGCGAIAGVIASSVDTFDELPETTIDGKTIKGFNDWTCGVKFPDGRSEAWAWKLDLSKYVGYATIAFETYTVKDRLIIWIDGSRVIDTGCVATNREVPTNWVRTGNSRIETKVYVPQQAQRMWVAVLPNCEGGFNTWWQLEIDCPDGHKRSDDRRVLKSYRTNRNVSGMSEHIKQDWS